MAPIFKSGAFIQQCFAAHRLCLSLKKYSGTEKILLACSSCNLQHRLTLRGFSGSVVGEVEIGDTDKRRLGGAGDLTRCAAEHPDALGVSEMDVLQEFIRLRCAECRRVYDLQISLFETHQR